MATLISIESKEIIRLSIPIGISQLCSQMMFTIAMLLMGHSGHADDLAAISLGAIFTSITGFALLNGVLSAIDTLASIAFGAQDMKKVGQAAFTGVALSAAVAVFFVGPLWWMSDSLLLFVHQDPKVALLASRFARWSILGLPAFVLHDGLKRFLQAQSIVTPISLSSLVAILSSTLFNYAFVIHLGWGIDGASMAYVAASWVQFLALSIWFYRNRSQFHKSLKRMNQKFFDLLPEYTSLAVPGVLMTCAEWWGIELISLVAGIIGNVELAATSIMLNVVGLIYMISLSIGTITTARIGFFLGSNDSASAATTATAALSLVSVVLSSTTLLICFLKTEIASIFSSEPAVVDLTSRLFPLGCGFMLADGAQTVAIGVLRGCAQQKIGAIANLVAYYLIGFPLGLYLAFSSGYGLFGQWAGINIGSFLLFVFYFRRIYHHAWKVEKLISASTPPV